MIQKLYLKILTLLLLLDFFLNFNWLLFLNLLLFKHNLEDLGEKGDLNRTRYEEFALGTFFEDVDALGTVLVETAFKKEKGRGDLLAMGATD